MTTTATILTSDRVCAAVQKLEHSRGVEAQVTAAGELIAALLYDARVLQLAVGQQATTIATLQGQLAAVARVPAGT